MWVNNHRQRREKLSLARQKALENIPGWTWKKAFDDAWDFGFERLQQFAEREGHTLVPQEFTETGIRLGQWVGVQRNLSPKQAFTGEAAGSGERSDLGLEHYYLTRYGEWD